MIIPHVVSVVQSNNKTTPIMKPEYCPICGSTLAIRALKKSGSKSSNTSENEIDFYCPNDECEGKLANKIEFVFSKPCLNAKGLSLKTISKLISLGKVHKVTDMFNVTKDDFLSMDGFKEKSAENMYSSLQSCRKNVSFSKFIPACGILSISFSVGSILADNFKSYDELLTVLEDKDVERLSQLNGLGGILINKLVSKEFIDSYRNLKSFVEISYPETENKVNVLSSSEIKTFVITGELSKPRSYFQDLIKECGHKVAGSVSKKTFALVTDDVNSESSKAKKARELGIKVFDETMLMSFLGK